MPDDDCTVDIDPHALEFLERRHDVYAELRGRCPVAWNARHGGFWVVTDHESVASIARDNETFAHRFEAEPEADGFRYRGILGVPRPPTVLRQGVSEIDGPEHADLRRLLHPFLTPQRVEELRPRAVELAHELVDGFIESGEADLVLDFATPLPAVLTLDMVGIPSRNWKYFADFFHAGSAYVAGSREFNAAMARWPEMMGEIQDHIALRRREPADDLTTALVSGTLDGHPIDDGHLGDILWNLLAGGIDTTTSLVSWGLHHLGTHPEDRDRLVAERALVSSAVEEFLRHFCPNEALSRTATRDVEISGTTIRRGDLVFISWVSANHDELVFDRADEVVVDRQVNKHLAFGLGGHRCIGSHLARMEAQVMLDEILERIPDYEIDPGRFVPSPGNPLVTTVVSMPVSFTPGTRWSPS